MQTFLKPALLLFIISFASNAFACHEGDFESSGKGEQKRLYIEPKHNTFAHKPLIMVI